MNSANILRIAPELKRIDVPDELKVLPAWLCWRAERHEGESKDRKIPYWASGGRRSGEQGGVEDRSKLVSFAAALSAAQKLGMTGVGFAPLPDFGITVLDFDKCVGPNGETHPDIDAVTARTFSEYSPSGTGIHAVLRGNLGDARVPAVGSGFGMDVFSTKGFVTFTGAALPHVDLLGLENTVALVTPEVEAIVTRYVGANRREIDRDPEDFTKGFEPVLGLTEDEAEGYVQSLDPDMGRESWLTVGLALHHEFHGSDEAFAVWDAWSSGGASYPGTDALEYQWRSFKGPTPGRRSVTMASVIKMARDAEAALSPAEMAQRVETKVETLISGTPAGFTGKFPIQQAAEMASQKPLDWLIKNVIPAADLGVLFGASGSGKSFAALDLCVHVARGEPWRGHRVRQGGVVIVAAEGGGGYGKRIKAYCQHHHLDASKLPLGIVNAAPNILEADDISELAASVRAMGGVSLIVIDTLAQVTPGANENTSEDMGKALANAMVLRRVTGAMVLLIHHAGKDLSRGARGWSGIKGALDVEIEVSRDEMSDVRELRLSKMKDEEDGLRFGFKLEVVTVGMDEDGDELRSCVAVEAEVQQRATPAEMKLRGTDVKQRGRWQMALIGAVEALAPLPHAEVHVVLDKALSLEPDASEVDSNETAKRRESLRRALLVMAKEPNGPVGLDTQRNKVVFYAE